MALTDAIKDTVDKIASTVGELPAAPAIVSAAMRLTANLQSNITDMARVLSADQSLTAKVLKLSNSPYYGRSRKVRTLNEAIIVLGFNAVRSMVIATSAHGMFISGGNTVAQAKLWQHSLSTATAARQIATQIKHPKKEEIFVAALLHDVGKLVLLQKLPEWYLRIIGEVEKLGCSFGSVESRVLLFDHCDVASVLLSKWSFPASLVRAISCHHQPPALRSGDVVPIAQVINLANYMAKKLDVGFDDEKVENLTDLESAQSMALDEETLNQIFEEFQGHYREEIRAFEES